MEAKSREVFEGDYVNVFRGNELPEIKNISLDEYNFTEEQKLELQEEFLKIKGVIKYNIKELSKGKNLRNPKKVESLKALRILDRTTYNDIDTFIKAMILHEKVGRDENGKGTIDWNEAIKIN